MGTLLVPGNILTVPSSCSHWAAVVSIQGVSMIQESSVCVKGVRSLVLAWYHLVTTLLLTINFILLTSLPEPPVLAPRRGVTRRWRRERFLERCRTRNLRLSTLFSTE